MQHSPPLSRSDNALLARLPQPVYHRLAPALEPVPLDPNGVLYHPGDPLRYVYFPLGGIVAWLVPMQDGKPVEHATVGREGVVGVMSLMDFEATIHQAAVQFPGQALRMTTDDFRAAARPEGPFRLVLAQYIKAYLTQITQTVACNAAHSVKQRCCRWLLLTQDRLQMATFPVTQTMLAQSLRVRRASVSDVVRELQEAGVIRFQRGKLSIVDHGGLEAASCECYAVAKAAYERALA